MLPFQPGTKYKLTPLTPAPLSEPIDVEFTFTGGPFDGRKSTARVGAVMSDRFTVWMKKDNERFLYRYAGDNKFKYEGIHEECPAPSSLETAPA
jgi:hypothetical protein